MFCSHCGANLPDDAAQCPQCGQELSGSAAAVQTPPSGQEEAPAQDAIKDYQTVNIILLVASVLCCGGLPATVTGIIGVVFSSQVRSLMRSGALEQARDKAKTAKGMAIATGILVGVGLILSILFFALYGSLLYYTVSETMSETLGLLLR